MASLVVVAAILIAVKSPDWIEQYKQHKLKQQKNNDSHSVPTEEYVAPSSDAQDTTSGKRSKREILTRRYWHERRELSRQYRDQEWEGSGRRRGSLEAPPPYNEPPMYQELEKGGDLRSDGHPSLREPSAPEYSTR
ncbi:hypothetical protein BJX63DRAFT_433399 [Aspergillus granulosus]|uniref:Uncharacterized protein n=1 Tax=Aspergillus granulosus TaxID=176169 RepID=A0ABR4H7F2_9EURO